MTARMRDNLVINYGISEAFSEDSKQTKEEQEGLPDVGVLAKRLA